MRSHFPPVQVSSLRQIYTGLPHELQAACYRLFSMANPAVAKQIARREGSLSPQIHLVVSDPEITRRQIRQDLQALRNSPQDFMLKFNALALLWAAQMVPQRDLRRSNVSGIFLACLVENQRDLLEELGLKLPDAQARAFIGRIESLALTAEIRADAAIFGKYHDDTVVNLASGHTTEEVFSSQSQLVSYRQSPYQKSTPLQDSIVWPTVQPLLHQQAYEAAHAVHKRSRSSDLSVSFRNVKPRLDELIENEILNDLNLNSFHADLDWAYGHKESLPPAPAYIQALSKTRLTYSLMQSSDQMRRYVVTNTLHYGGFGKVRYAVDLVTKELFAVKVTRFEEKQLFLPQELLRERSRVSIHSTSPEKLSNEWALTIYALEDRVHVADTLTVKDKQYTIFQPLMHNNVDHLLESAPLITRLSLTLSLGYKIAREIEYLHAKDVVHCDLKNSNILWRYDESVGDVSVLVSDFGQAFDLASGPIDTNHAGTYINPRYINRLAPNKTTDIWNLGHMLCDMMVPRHHGSAFHYKADNHGVLNVSSSKSFLDVYYQWNILVQKPDGTIDPEKVKSSNTDNLVASVVTQRAKQGVAYFQKYFSYLYMMNRDLTQYILDHMLNIQEEKRDPIDKVVDKLEFLRNQQQVAPNAGQQNFIEVINQTPEVQAQHAVLAYAHWLLPGQAPPFSG